MTFSMKPNLDSFKFKTGNLRLFIGMKVEVGNFRLNAKALEDFTKKVSPDIQIIPIQIMHRRHWPNCNGRIKGFHTGSIWKNRPKVTKNNK